MCTTHSSVSSARDGAPLVHPQRLWVGPFQIIHRDIKLENLLLGTNKQLKIIDFGLCSEWAPGKLLRVHCGSPSYAAPEIVGRKSYLGPPVDVWSLGVVLFAMACGYLPF